MICCDVNEMLPEFDLAAGHKSLTGVTMKDTLSLNVTQCNLEVHRRFGGNSALIFMIEEKAKSCLLRTSC
jgi:hypothetical protein